MKKGVAKLAKNALTITLFKQLQQAQIKKEESHMWRHQQQAHPEKNVTFTIKVVKRFLSSFEREVSESIYIEVNQNIQILNKKSGFNRCLIPRLSVMMGEKEYHETVKKDAYSVDEFDQISTDKARRGRKKPRDVPEVLKNDIISPLAPPPGKRKKYILNRQVHTDRVDPEECSRNYVVGSKSRKVLGPPLLITKSCPTFLARLGLIILKAQMNPKSMLRENLVYNLSWSRSRV